MVKDYEEKIKKYWQEKDIYNQVKKKLEKEKDFVVIDGPPYPTGEPHIGLGRNWAIKDSVMRRKRLQGKNVYCRDGYDTHGLPVENKTQKKLNLTTVDDIKKFGVDNFMKECKNYANSIIDDMVELREEFGLWMDRTPYLTFHPEYISLAWRFFKEAEKKKMLYKSYKTVAWCPCDETTLSDYEIKDSYQILKDPSIYVKFKAKYHKIGKGGGVVIENEYGEILIAQRNEPGREQSIGIVGGKAELTDKNMIETIQRKCLEEIGITPENLEIVGSNIDFFEGRIFHTYHAKGFLKKNTQFKKIDALKNLRWIKKDELEWDKLHIPTKNCLKNVLGLKKFANIENEKPPIYFLIWTTTPWTLGSNMLIAVNPNFDYASVEIEFTDSYENQIWVVAKNLVNKVLEKVKSENNIKSYRILDEFKGKELEGIKYEHILLNETPSQKVFQNENNKKIHSIVLADFVTLGEGEDILEKLEKKGYKHTNNTEQNEKIKTGSKKEEGTGLVHIAPGHGFDDYNTGIENNIPIFCPVNEKGIFTEGLCEGKYFRDSNQEFIDYLKEKGDLIFAQYKEHKYPTCWRCKTPIVYRAAQQWWIKRGEYKKDIISLNKKDVNWYPSSASKQFENLMKNVGDWPISRQRFWGTPLPIWECKNCGKYEVFQSREELEEASGKKLKDLHLDDIRDIKLKCECGCEKEHVKFIADVWFDSGCASFASHYNEGLSYEEIIQKYYPLSWITEGEDQVRGWFSSLFNVGYVITQQAPYKNVLYYKYIMDKDGKKMSKSIGNGVMLNDALKDFGPDISRYYLITKTAPEEQLNFNIEEVKEVENFFVTFRNVCKYLNSYLEKHKNPVNENFENLKLEDQWILYKLNKVIKESNHFLDNYKLNIGYKKLEEFVLRDVSRIYLKFVKERTSEFDSSLHYTFNKILNMILINFSPVTPFMCEDIYLTSNLKNKKESIFLEDYVQHEDFILHKIEKNKLDENFEIAFEIIQSVLNAREKSQIGLRWPLDKVSIISNSELKNNLKMLEKLIKTQLNIKKLNFGTDQIEISYNIKPNFDKIKNDFDNVGEVIKIINQNKNKINQNITDGITNFEIENLKLNTNEHLIKELILPQGYISSNFNDGYIILDTKQDEILIEEGYLRELIRRIQMMRKENNLTTQDKITISIEGSDNYFLDLIKNWQNTILKKVNAQTITNENLNNQEFKIKDYNLKLGIKILK